MQVTPRHFHLTAASVLGVAAIVVAAAGHVLASGFIGLGALVAILHWKAAKSGIID